MEATGMVMVVVMVVVMVMVKCWKWHKEIMSDPIVYRSDMHKRLSSWAQHSTALLSYIQRSGSNLYVSYPLQNRWKEMSAIERTLQHSQRHRAAASRLLHGDGDGHSDGDGIGLIGSAPLPCLLNRLSGVFEQFCPVSWAEDQSLVRHGMDTSAYLGIFKGVVYNLSCREHYEKFMKSPLQYVDGAHSRTFPRANQRPARVPRHRIVGMDKSSFELQAHCAVLLSNSISSNEDNP